MDQLAVFWFRRDLRLNDNHGLLKALESGYRVLPLFIFDKNILNDLKNKEDARVYFIHNQIEKLNESLHRYNSGILVEHGVPEEVWKNLITVYDIKAVYCNEDFEPYTIQRDHEIKSLLESNQIVFSSCLDHLIFRPDAILKDDNKPYTVYTPYNKKWRDKLSTLGISRAMGPLREYKSDKLKNYYEFSPVIPSLEDIGFKPSTITFPPESVPSSKISKYDKTRNFPAVEGTSKLGIHYRFGTISIREKLYAALNLNETYVNELIWREFYAQILFHFPNVVKNSFRIEYERIQWRNNKEDFQRWCEGKTGYALVDAGMRELNTTGYMHNRVRMLTASFLTKHLLIDWRWGEAYFAEKLLDYELASNNGGWQWASGSGTDAAPYFRIFSPMLQLEKFDSNRSYVKRYVEEYGTSKYPQPVVDHKFARERCLEVYKNALKKD